MPIIRKFGSGYLRREISDDVEKTRMLSFVLSNYTRDRHGTVLNQDNWVLEPYKMNPVIAYQHNLSPGLFSQANPDMIIAKTVDIGTQGSGREKKLIAVAQFEDEKLNPLAGKIFNKLVFGSLSAASVGFSEIGQGRYGSGPEARGGENETYYFHGQELLEWSIVNLPSNPQTGKRSFVSQDWGVRKYAMNQMSDVGLLQSLKTPSQVERLQMEDIEALIEVWQLGSRTTDPQLARKLLKEREQRLKELAELKTNRLMSN